MITTELIALGHHLFVNIWPLHFWANGNFLLLTNSFFTAFLTFCSLMLLVESNVWLYADYTTRMVAFIASLLTTTVFFAHLIGVLTKLYRGLVLHSINLLTVFNILSIYTLILELGSVAPAIHIFFFEALAISPFSIFNPKWGSWLP